MSAVVEISRLVSWARYLFWADLHRQAFETFLNGQKVVETSQQRARFFALMSQCYGSLWVVVEGWRQLKTADVFVDGLLSNQPEYCELLRLYRNGVFHFQPDFLDARFLGFLTEGAGPIEWANALHSEFLRFLWEWPDSVASDPATAHELRSELREIVGWLPDGSRAAMISALEAKALAAEEELGPCPDPTMAALDLGTAASIAREVARQERSAYFSEQKSHVTRRWLPGLPE